MKKIMSKITLLVLIPVGLSLLLSACCEECCGPSIEVGVPTPGYTLNDMQMWTWSDILQFPASPDVIVTGNQLTALRPYLAQGKVTNFSDVEVRGVTVVFYWGSFGAFDKGTPIGAVSVDIPARATVVVRSPWTFLMSYQEKQHMCLAMRVFHSCDTDLKNNSCYHNYLTIVLPNIGRPFAIPFTVDLDNYRGLVHFNIEAPDGVDAKVLKDVMPTGTVDSLEMVNSIRQYTIKQGSPEQLSLLIQTDSSVIKPGDEFEIIVTVVQDEMKISSFVVHATVSKEMEINNKMP